MIKANPRVCAGLLGVFKPKGARLRGSAGFVAPGCYMVGGATEDSQSQA